MNNYRRNRKNSNKIIKNTKDYLIPWIILGFFILLLLFNIFSWWDNKKENNSKTTQSQTNNSIQISFKTPETKAYIKESKTKKIPLKDKSNFELWKTIFVEKWIVELKQEWSFDGKLNKLWELSITKNTDKDSDLDKVFRLKTSQFFIIPKKKEKIKMNLLTALLNDDSVVSVYQNDAYSSVYVLAWAVNIKTNAWKDITITKWKKISIWLSDTNDEDLDLNTKKENIDSSFLEDEWCTINKCSDYLNKSDEKNKENKDKKIPKKSKSLWKVKWLIKLSNLEDQEEVFDNTINLKWTILKKDLVDKITFNNKEAEIDNDLWIFKLKWLELNSSINDIVYKVFDNEWELIDRWVYTIYYNWKLGGKNNINNINDKNKVKNYPLDFEEKFKIIGPVKNSNTFTTTASSVRLEWNVPAWEVEKIKVNNFTLTKFKPGWTYWNFFANAKYWYLKNWINKYYIKYYWKDWKVIYDQVFTIIKK